MEAFPAIIEKVLASDFLTSREKEILQSRLEGKTLQIVGEKFGITRERVRQIEEKIKYKIIDKLEHQEVEDYSHAVGVIRSMNTEEGNYFELARANHPNAYNPWHMGEIKIFKEMYDKFIQNAAEELGRSRGAIRSRLKKILKIEEVTDEE